MNHLMTVYGYQFPRDFPLLYIQDITLPYIGPPPTPIYPRAYLIAYGHNISLAFPLTHIQGVTSPLALPSAPPSD